MRYLIHIILCLLMVVFLTTCSISRHGHDDYISPLDYGLMNAQTGTERYEILYKTHVNALQLGKGVDYLGIKNIDLEIPQGAKSIPLSENTNFRGVTISVVNNNKTFFLFEYKKEMTPLVISTKDIDDCRYTSTELKSGLFLLSIKDENPWVLNREGHSYGATRQDVVLIKDGVGEDSPCSTYSTKSSAPVYSYRRVTKAQKAFSNLTFNRRPGSTKLTKLVKFSCENNVHIENISITTPADSLYGDQAICIENCSNVILKNITINGTYSTSKKFGYGISMNNVWNVYCQNIQSNTAWGVFGTNNAHKVHLEDCNINRFDVHCYGKDILCDNCIFNGMGGVYSSVFGAIEYRNCTFNDACPYTNRPDYNAYVDFNLILKNCIFIPSYRHYFLINIQVLNNKINERAELKKKCLPNVTIENLTVYIPEDIKAIGLFRLPENTYTYPVGGISDISIEGMTFKYKEGKSPVSLKLSTTEIQVENRLSCMLDGLNLLPETENVFAQRTKKYDYSGSVIINMKSSKGEDINISNSRLNYNVTSNSQHYIKFTGCTIGCIRQTPKTNQTTRRFYNNCKIYLNGCDNNLYYLDDYAEYSNCTIIPANPDIKLSIPRQNNINFNKSIASPTLRIDGGAAIPGLTVSDTY